MATRSMRAVFDVPGWVAFAFATALLAPCAGVAQEPAIRLQTPDAGRKVCIAHRGASAYAPEHTLAAYKMAIEMGADYVEQDLAVTKDGALVCLHDDTLERTTNVAVVFPERFYKEGNPSGKLRKTWRVADFTLAELKTLDAGSWFDAAFEGERIPTFEEAIDLVKGKAGIYPELKSPGFHRRMGFEMEKLVYETMKAKGLDDPGSLATTPVFVQSFEPESLKRFRAIAGDAFPLVQLATGVQAAALLGDVGMSQTAKYANGIGPAIDILVKDPTRVAEAKKYGLAIHPYTVNWNRVPERFADATEWMEWLLNDLGVDGVFTDNPDLFPGRTR